jgi:hypothetical protein
MIKSFWKEWVWWGENTVAGAEKWVGFWYGISEKMC